MPSYPDATPAIQTDINLYGTDLAAHIDHGLVVRSIYEPATQTMTVRIYAQTVPQPRLIAERVIFTGVPETVSETPGEPE